MSKKAQGVLWLLLAIIVIALIGLVTFTIVKAYTNEVTHPEVTFEFDNYGEVKLKLYPEYAPNTVSNFLYLANKGYYNDKVIYGKDEVGLYIGRNEKGEVDDIKASYYDSSIEKDSDADYTSSIFGEFLVNGFNDNTLSHGKYFVSMGREDYSSISSNLASEGYNSASSQFVILEKDSKALNGMYAVFAEVVEGKEAVDKLYGRAVEEKSDDAQGNGEEIQKFASFKKITNVKVDTHGIDYGVPKIQKKFDYQSYIQRLYSQSYTTE